MRLNVAFLLLLTAATLATGLEFRAFPEARDGDALARAVVFGAAVVWVPAVALLVRIVARVDALRREEREDSG